MEATVVKAIAFAWTTPALLAGRKTVTRREWDDRYAAQFHCGDLVAAWDRQPRYGRHRVAVLKLTTQPIKESTASAPPEDYEREGFLWMETHGLLLAGVSPEEVWRSWHEDPQDRWTIRFELVEVVA